jgi:hypothetical protein
MERQGPTATVLVADYFPPELERLCRTAAAVLHEHIDADGRCVVCGSAGRASVPSSRNTTWRSCECPP